MGADASFWKRCSTCKKELPFAGTYWACNVSTCNRPRTALVFCADSDGSRAGIPIEAEHRFRGKPNTRSDRIRTVIPSQAEHPAG